MPCGPTVAVLSPVTGGFYFGGILSGIAREVAAVGGQVVPLQTLDAGRSGTRRWARPTSQAGGAGGPAGGRLLGERYVAYRAKAAQRGSWVLHGCDLPGRVPV